MPCWMIMQWFIVRQMKRTMKLSLVLISLPDQDGIIIFRQNSICLFIVKGGLIWDFLRFIVMIMLL